VLLWTANAGVVMLTAAIAAQKISLERFAIIRPLRAVIQDDALLSTRQKIGLDCRKVHHVFLNKRRSPLFGLKLAHATALAQAATQGATQSPTHRERWKGDAKRRAAITRFHLR
jgi:hypothetical protein